MKKHRFKNTSLIAELEKPIVLVGLPGCGKSTLGRIIARKLKYHFFDSDFEIEKKVGMIISDIFYFFNEDFFRKKEFETIKHLLTYKKTVIATGGGAFANEATHKLLANKAVSIYIKTPVSEIVSRMQKKEQASHRPLIDNCENIEEKYQQLLTARQNYYEKANITLNWGNSVDRSLLMDKIIPKLNEYVSVAKNQ